MKKVYFKMCLIFIMVTFLTSGCIKSDVTIKFDNHDNMTVETLVLLPNDAIDLMDSFVDDKKISGSDLTKDINSNIEGLNIQTEVQNIDSKDEYGTKKVELCRNISKAKKIKNISVISSIDESIGVLQIDNYLFFKKYIINGKIDKDSNNNFDNSNDISANDIITLKIKICPPSNAVKITSNSNIRDINNPKIYVWKIDCTKENPIELEFYMINWLLIFLTIVTIIVISSYFLFFNNDFSLKNCNSYILEKRKYLQKIFHKKNHVSQNVNVTKAKRPIFIKKIYITVMILGIAIILIYFSIPKICEYLINNSIASIYAGKPEKAIQYVEIAKTLSPHNNFSSSIYSKGLEELDKNNMTNAESFMKMVIALEPNEKSAYSEQLMNKSVSAIANKQYSKAQKLMEYALKFDKEKINKNKTDFAKKYINSLTAKNYEEALAYANILILISPNDEQAHFNKGFILYFLKQPKESIESYTKAINIRNNDVRAYLGRANTYLSINEYDKALYDSKKVIEFSRDPKMIAQARYYIADSYMKKGQYRNAMNEAFLAKDLFYRQGNIPMYRISAQLFDEAAYAECTYGTYCYY